MPQPPGSRWATQSEIPIPFAMSTLGFLVCVASVGRSSAAIFLILELAMPFSSVMRVARMPSAASPISIFFRRRQIFRLTSHACFIGKWGWLVFRCAASKRAMGPASLLAATAMQRCVKRWDPFERATRIDFGGHCPCGFNWYGSFERCRLARIPAACGLTVA